jgi:hypothetical protein
MRQVIRSPHTSDITGIYGDGFKDLMLQNPVYHYGKSFLISDVFKYGELHFDTSPGSDDYRIKYDCYNCATEPHGINGFFGGAFLAFKGESREHGVFIIDRETFAFKRIERKAVRNKEYNYPRNNNYVLPLREYTAEFVYGDLVAEYESIKGKWFLKSLLHQYTNEFFRVPSNTKMYRMTDNFEWYSGSVSRYVDESLLDQFQRSPNLARSYSSYYTDSIEAAPDFYYFKGESVYRDVDMPHWQHALAN